MRGSASAITVASVLDYLASPEHRSHPAGDRDGSHPLRQSRSDRRRQNALRVRWHGLHHCARHCGRSPISSSRTWAIAAPTSSAAVNSSSSPTTRIFANEHSAPNSASVKSASAPCLTATCSPWRWALSNHVFSPHPTRKPSPPGRQSSSSAPMVSTERCPTTRSLRSLDMGGTLQEQVDNLIDAANRNGGPDTSRWSCWNTGTANG